LDEWRALLAAADVREQLPNGMRYRFRGEFGPRIRSLAAAEHECCSFLRFDVGEAPDAVEMTVKTDDETGLAALRFIFA
jgi:hypothetical protein